VLEAGKHDDTIKNLQGGDGTRGRHHLHTEILNCPVIDPIAHQTHATQSYLFFLDADERSARVDQPLTTNVWGHNGGDTTRGLLISR
jgi:hypothetical protein